MFSKVFLAMTAAEVMDATAEQIAYMALHFSPYSAGLSNPPPKLPKNNILLLDDSTPPANHDPNLVAEQLKYFMDRHSAQALVLDFQKEISEASLKMAEHILSALPCTIAITKAYASRFQCPVFLSPTPVNKSLTQHLSPWLKQGIFLEIAPEAVQFTVTETGTTVTNVPTGHILPLSNKKLHCHYKADTDSHQVVFTLERTREDLSALTEDAYRLGVQGVIGLYQELK